MKLITMIVIGGLLCLGQLGRTQDLKERISEIKKERAELKTSRLRKEEPTTEPQETAVAKVTMLAQELERYRSGGQPEKWAALGLAIYDLPPAEIPALAQKLWAQDFSPRKAWIVQALIEHWSHYDLEAALEAATQLKEPHRVRALLGLIDPLLAKDPSLFEKFVLQHPIEQDLSVPYIKYLVEQDPRKAAKFVIGKMGGRNDATVSHLARFWAQEDPKAALQWAESLSDESRGRSGGQQGEALYGVFRRWQDIDREEALETVLKLEPGSPRRIGLSVIMGRWVTDDADAAFAHVFDELPAEDRNDHRFLQSLGSSVGNVDVDKVIAAAKRIEDAERRDMFLEKAASGRSDYDGRGLEVADLMQEGKRKDYVYRRAADDLASHDLTEATTWLATLPESRSRDAAVTALIGSLVRRNPQEAVGWAELITDSNHREKAHSTLASEWLRKDRAAATAWIQACEEFSETEKAGLLR